VKVASGLASGHQAGPELAERAVGEALAAAGLARASQVLLFLTRDFIRQATPAILAAARTAGCLQVFGCTASGLFTERGVLLDQPGAAALVIADAPPPGAAEETPDLALCGRSGLPFDWMAGRPRAGLLDADAVTWAQARQCADACAETHLPGWCAGIALSTGCRPLAAGQTVDVCDAYELRRVAGQTAVASLRRSLPAELRERLPLHQIVILRQADEPGIAILAANADGSLTLAEPLAAGDQIGWAVRQPLAAEQDMRQALDRAGAGRTAPDFALMFSCIGRGPLFYGGEDRDLLAFRTRFPGIPLLGAYGNGQIAPTARGNRLFHHSVVTLLFEGTHV